MNYKVKTLLLDAVTLGFLTFTFYLKVAAPSEEELLAGMNAYLLIGMACLGLGAAISLVLNRAGIKTLGESLFEPPHKKAGTLLKPWITTFWGAQLAITFIVTLILAFSATQFSLRELGSQEGIAGAMRIFKALFTPELKILPEGIIAIVETIFIAFLATVLAIPFAFFLCFLCAKNIMKGSTLGMSIYTLLRTLMNVTRSLEPLIWAIIFSVWVGIGPFAGMLSLMLHSISSLVKQYSEIVECVHDGPIEGIQSTGANRLQVIWFAVIPQIVLPFISYTIYRWDINVRMATIIGLVGGGGIGNLLIQYQGQAQWSEVGTLAVLIVIIVWLMDLGSAYIREAIK